MKKTIGIVCEGPRDSDLLSEVAYFLFPNIEFSIRYLQPEITCQSSYGNGWKGVWKWCADNGNIINEVFKGISPNLDLLIVHMDGDVSRAEKESHCKSMSVACEHKDEVTLPDCVYYDHCPVVLPCNEHGEPPRGYANHLRELLSTMFLNADDLPIIFVIPCDSTDAWIIAALDQIEGAELIENPWNTVIAKKKTYHGVRVRKDQKAAIPYRALIKLMLSKWSDVVNECEQANVFQEELNSTFDKA